MQTFLPAMHDTCSISGPVFGGRCTAHSALILLQQLDMHLGDVQMDFLCKKKQTMTDA